MHMNPGVQGLPATSSSHILIIIWTQFQTEIMVPVSQKNFDKNHHQSTPQTVFFHVHISIQN